MLLIAGGGCGREPQSVQEKGLPRLRRGTVVRIGVLIPKFGALHPLLSDEPGTDEVLGALFRPLWDFDDAWHPRPLLISEIPPIDRKSLVTRFQLRSSLKWSDGTPFTAKEIFLSHPALLHPFLKKRPVGEEAFARVRGITQSAPLALEVRWKKPWSFPFLGFYPVREELLRPLLEGAPSSQALREFERVPISNGPYRLLVWNAGGGIAVPNEHYLLSRPGFQRVVFSGFPAEKEILAALKERKIDLVPHASPSLVAAARELPNQVVHSVPGPVGIGVWLNLDHPWLAARELREALLASLNRRSMVNRLFGPWGTAAESWLPPSHPMMRPVSPAVPPDPTKVRYLLSEAGWEMGREKVLVQTGKGAVTLDPTGEELVLEFAFPEGDDLARRLLGELEKTWGEIGVRLRSVPIPPKEYRQYLRRRKFAALAYERVERGPLVEAMLLWHSTAIPSAENGWSGGNLAGWRDPENDRLCREIAAALDSDARTKPFATQQERWAEEIPFIPIGWLHDLSVARKELKGVKPRGFPPTTWNIEEWRWEPGKSGEK